MNVQFYQEYLVQKELENSEHFLEAKSNLEKSEAARINVWKLISDLESKRDNLKLSSITEASEKELKKIGRAHV